MDPEAPFEVAASTLESLEWDRITDALRMRCRTPIGAARLGAAGGSGDRAPVAGLFARDEEAVRRRLAETSEARALHEAEAPPPIAGASELASALARAEKDGVLEPEELVAVRRTLEAMHGTLRFFARRRAETPALSALAREIGEARALEAELARCLDEHGAVRDAASPALAEARRDAHRLGGELQSRIERTLRHADVAPHLSDAYYTVRSGRFVLPVKADARSRVPGIVHDASRSGTTLFVEPEGMIELNNRHREAELTVEREIRRVLRTLSAGVGREAPLLRDALDRLAELDLALARGRLSLDLDATEPEVGREGIIELPGLRHPLIPASACVPNDLRIGRDFSVLLLSGPNAGGKTVALKAIALAALMVRAGLHVPAAPGARVDLFDAVLADIGDHQDIGASLSTFSAAMASLAGVLREAGPDTLVCLDEIGVGTDPSEGAAIAQAALEALAEDGARVVTTTHYNLLKEMAEIDERFANASVEFDPGTLAPTYRVRIGAPGASSATTVAARMGLPPDVLDRAAALLDREDRRLDRMLAELGASRALLASEQATAAALRAESEALRETYRLKLARLQERRDELFGEMRRELDDAFRDAHGEVARIIAALQRAPSSREAAKARERLETLRAETGRAQAARGLGPGPPASDTGASADARAAAVDARPIDWPRARIGDAVRAPGGGRGRLLSLPDRRGRVQVRIGANKVSLSRDQLLRDAPSAAPVKTPDPGAEPESRLPARIGGRTEIDLRGLRVEEAIDRLEAALDLAAAEGRDELLVIHGIGTGALRAAVREHLPRSPFVRECEEAAREEGAAGATRAVLAKD